MIYYISYGWIYETPKRSKIIIWDTNDTNRTYAYSIYLSIYRIWTGFNSIDL